MGKKRPARTNLIIRIAFSLIFIFLFVSVINLQNEMKSLRDDRDARAKKVTELQDNIDELELRINTPVDEEFIKRIARDRLGLRDSDEIIFYTDIGNK